MTMEKRKDKRDIIHFSKATASYLYYRPHSSLLCLPLLNNLNFADSHVALLESSCFGDVCFALEHGLPHPGYVCAAHVLAAVHLAVVHHPLPRVVARARSLHRLVVLLLHLLVRLALLLDLLLPLSAPLVEFGLSCDSALLLL